jgi:FkbM family methyltransferase
MGSSAKAHHAAAIQDNPQNLLRECCKVTMMTLLYGLRNYHALFGRRGVSLALKSRILGKVIQISACVPGLPHPLHLRLRNSDVTLLRSIFLDGEYDWSFLKAPGVIIDAGANIGFTSVVYANRYPEASVIAIEPEASNFQLLKENAASYPNIELVHGALWKENTKLRILDPGLGSWAFRTQETAAGKQAPPDRALVEAFTLDKILSDHKIEFVDILKVDIEGAEKEVFENSAAWIDRVGIIIIELHDSYKPGCSKAVHAAANGFDFSWHRGETTVLGRKAYGGQEPHGLDTYATRRDRLNSQLPFAVAKEDQRQNPS